MTRTCFPRAEILSFSCISSPANILFCCARISIAKYIPDSSRPGIAKSRACGVPVHIAYASNPSGKCARSISSFVLKIIPSSSIICNLRSMIFFPSLKLGIPYLNKPPGISSRSNTVTSYPRRLSWFAAASPAGPEPMTATFLPFLSYLLGIIYPSRNAASIIAASSSRIVTGESMLSFRTHDFSHSAGHILPVNSGKSLVLLNISYALCQSPLQRAS